MQSKKTPASAVALGGVLAALAVVIMCLGTLIPIATYVCPAICMLLVQTVTKLCGRRMGWAWYGAVSLLSLLMAPDKEAAGVFLLLGYYPIVKPWMDSRKGKWLWKAMFFNASIALLYWVMLHLLGLEQVAQDYSGAGVAMGVLLVVLGNLTFFLLDILLSRGIRRRRGR